MDDEIAPTNPPSTDKSEGIRTDDICGWVEVQAGPVSHDCEHVVHQSSGIYYAIGDDIFEENETFVIKKEDDSSSNGKDEELTIHKKRAVCRHCSILIEKDSHVFNVQCECTKISLIHDNCKDPWFQAQGPTCSYCDKQRDCARVVVSPKIAGEKPNGPTPKRPWWHFWN